MSARHRTHTAVVAYITEHGYPPSIRELCEILGYSSPATVHAHLQDLIDEGLLVRGPRHSAIQIGLAQHPNR